MPLVNDSIAGRTFRPAMVVDVKNGDSRRVHCIYYEGRDGTAQDCYEKAFRTVEELVRQGARGIRMYHDLRAG